MATSSNSKIKVAKKANANKNMKTSSQSVNKKNKVASNIVSKAKKSSNTTKLIKEVVLEEKIIDTIISNEKKVDTIEVIDTVILDKSNDKNSVITESVDIIINYKKYNPFVFKSKNHTDPFHLSKNKSFNKIYNGVKYPLIILTILFAIMSLYFSSIWQSSIVASDIKFIDGKLPTGSDILAKLFGLDINSFIDPSHGIYNSQGNTVIPSEVISLLTANIWNLKNTLIDYSDIQVLFAFGIIGIISSVSLLAFKNGTAWSVSMLVLTYISFIIVLEFFVMGIISTMPAVNDAKNIVKALNGTDTIAIKNALTAFVNNFNF